MLWDAGWQPTGFGKYWHEVKFRRPVRKSREEGAAASAGAGASSLPEADWYPDPTRRFEHRYWDGVKWTQHVSTKGKTSEDRRPAQGPPPSA